MQRVKVADVIVQRKSLQGSDLLVTRFLASLGSAMQVLIDSFVCWLYLSQRHLRVQTTCAPRLGFVKSKQVKAVFFYSLIVLFIYLFLPLKASQMDCFSKQVAAHWTWPPHFLCTLPRP